MNATYAAALAIARESIGMMKDTIAEFSDEALDWRPREGMNPVSVLVTHSVTSTRFFARCGAGQPGSILAYRTGDRAASFAAAGGTVASYLQMLTSLEGELAELFAAARDSDLKATIAWPGEDPSLDLTGAECLFRAIGHLREHVGHAQALHDLWLAEHAAVQVVHPMTKPAPFMQLALDAAASVRGATSPNPWVGAVLVRDGQVIATGATSPPSGPHAEAAALANVDARGADVYVTLEPCAPFDGKRTRPCAEALVEAGVRRVIVALQDPDPNIAGRGVAILRQAGIEVSIGEGHDRAVELLRPYLKHRRLRLPYVIAKFAASLDGRTSTRTGDSKWITGPDARDLGHQQRARADAVMAGSGTVLADDPELTARPGGVLAPHQPARVILDSRGRIAPSAALFRSPGHVIVATTCDATSAWKGAIAATGAQVIECERTKAGLDLHQLLSALGERGIMSIWAEGGPTLLGSLFDSGNVDELWAFIAPVIIGGAGRGAVGGAGVGLVSHAWSIHEPVIQQVGRDILVRGYTGNWSP